MRSVLQGSQRHNHCSVVFKCSVHSKTMESCKRAHIGRSGPFLTPSPYYFATDRQSNFKRSRSYCASPLTGYPEVRLRCYYSLILPFSAPLPHPMPQAKLDWQILKGELNNHLKGTVKVRQSGSKESHVVRPSGREFGNSPFSVFSASLNTNRCRECTID